MYVIVRLRSSSELSRDVVVVVASKRGTRKQQQQQQEEQDDDDRERGGGDDEGGGGGGEARGMMMQHARSSFEPSSSVALSKISSCKGDENARMDRVAETEQNETRGRHIVLAEKEHADNVHALGGIHRPEETVGNTFVEKR